jgi:hypothetical protein
MVRSESLNWKSGSKSAPCFGTHRLSVRFVFASAAWELAEIWPSRNYSEGPFFWRESKHLRYFWAFSSVNVQASSQ